ncbi:O-methyltransferase [Haloglycomyces albus]|uniref:O-methyltransferase n=1 Tax=Haloglycomyces albus TaxID=526067 RepID=UPI00046D6B93|nr:O-methyltransferase [Haloglycomyces albus]
MSQSQWTAVDEYLEHTGIEEDEALKRAKTSSQEAGLPPIQVSPAQGKFLHLLASVQGAKRILEIGTLGGYSAIWMARALPADGHLVTLEVDPKHAKVAGSNVSQAGLTGLVDLRVAPALETLQKLVDSQEEPFDLVFIDADKESYPQYLEWSLKLTRPGSVIVADNVVRGGSVAVTSSADARVQGVRSYLEQVARCPRLDATVLQTVGVKGYDGFSLARVID